MTRVTHTRYRDTYIFECNGHTGFSSHGRDILCSAVSVLCYTLAAYLERLHGEGRLACFASDFSDGYVRLTYEFSDISAFEETAAAEAVNAILSGFALLEESFPDHISLDID